MQTASFSDGFPLSLTGYENPMGIIENVLFMRACQHGILHVSVYESGLTCQRALKADAMIPILTDYITHAFGRTLQWDFQSGLEEKVMLEFLESHDGSQSIVDLMQAVAQKVNRPCLYNRAEPKGLLDARTELRESAGIPLSVTLLMLDLSLESAIEMSRAYQLEMTGDTMEDTLDLTPVVRLLQHMDVQPRIDVPGDLAKRIEDTPTTSLNLADEIMAQTTALKGTNDKR